MDYLFVLEFGMFVKYIVIDDIILYICYVGVVNRLFIFVLNFEVFV